MLRNRTNLKSHIIIYVKETGLFYLFPEENKGIHYFTFIHGDIGGRKHNNKINVAEKLQGFLHSSYSDVRQINQSILTMVGEGTEQ